MFSIFQKIVALIETQFSTCIKILRSDLKGMHVSFLSDLSSGIISQRSYSYTPQQNRVVERKVHHLLDVRTLLIDSSIPSKLCIEPLSIVVYLINSLPTVTLNHDSPYL